MNFTEFKKEPLNFILKFSTLILTEKLQSRFLQSQKHSTMTSMYDVTATVGKTPPYRAAENLKSADAEKVIICTP